MNSYKDKIRYIAKTISKLFEGLEGMSLFNDMATNYGIPRTKAVSEFCIALEGVMQEKGYDIEHLGSGSFVASAVEAAKKFPNTIAKMTGYEIVSLNDGERIMSDDDEGAVKLSDGNFLIFHFEDAEVSYRKFSSSDGGL